MSAQLGTSETGQRKLAAIMLTDMVGYTMLSQVDEQKALRLLETHRKLIQIQVQKLSGQIIKTIGDGTLIEFPSALEAVECAHNIQSAIRDHNRDNPDQQIRLRIGIHIGDVIHRQGDVLGDAVNIASRIEPLAEPGGVCVTEQVYSQVRNKINARMAKLPAQQLKNVQIPIDIYKLVMPWDEQKATAALQTGFKRIASGIDSLDGEIGGGLPEATTTMIYGAPQTGRSVFSYHFLMASIKTREPCLFVMTDYDSEELARAMSSFGWDIHDAQNNGLVMLLDMTSTESSKNTDQLDPTKSGILQTVSLSVSIASLKDLMTKSVEVLKPLTAQHRRFRVVVDSLTPFFIYNPPMLVAKFLRQFAIQMKSLGTDGIILTHVEGSIDQQSELMIKSSVDNLIHLSGGQFIIDGMVGTPKTSMPYSITQEGLKIGA